MPSIIPSYIYTIFATVIVSTLVIGMCGLATSNIKQEAEKKQLSNIASYVAAKSLELGSNAFTNNLTSTVVLDVPGIIGDKMYWIRIANSSSETWVETGFGTSAVRSGYKTEIPLDISASGTVVSSSGLLLLSSYRDSAGVHLRLEGGS